MVSTQSRQKVGASPVCSNEEQTHLPDLRGGFCSAQKSHGSHGKGSGGCGTGESKRCKRRCLLAPLPVACPQSRSPRRSCQARPEGPSFRAPLPLEGLRGFEPLRGGSKRCRCTPGFAKDRGLLPHLNHSCL